MAIRPIDHAFSRRALFAGAGTVLTSFCTPLIAGERIPEPLSLLAPTAAYAEDATFEFDIATPGVIGLKVVDAASAEKTGIKGASVTITASDGNSENKAVATTDETGMAVVDITSLCEGPSDGGTYQCRADIKIRAAGCRPVDLSQVLLTGGTATALPVCSIAEGAEDVPHFRSVTFDGYEIQYLSSAFLSSKANDERHQIVARANIKGTTWARVSFWRWRSTSDTFPGFSDSSMTQLGKFDVSISESQKRELEAADAADEKAAAEGRPYDTEAYEDRWLRTAKMDERFLQSNATMALKPGDRLVMRIESSKNDAPYLMNVEFLAAPLAEATSGTYDCIPGLGGSGGITIALPTSVPAVGGSKLKIWTPDFPIVFECSAIGSLLLGFNYMAQEIDTDKGYNPFVKDNWTKSEVKSCKDQWKEFNDKFQKNWDGYKTMVKDQKDANGKRQKKVSTKMLTKFEVTALGQIFGELSYDWGESWKGTLNATIGVAGEGAVSFQIALGPVPLFLALDFSASLVASARFGMISNWSSDEISAVDKIVGLIKNANISWNDNQVAIVLDIEIGVSAGIGVAGVASIGVRGSAGITNYIGLWDASWLGTEGSAKHFFWPHYRLGMGADLSICAQVWLFKYSKKLCGVSAPELYDSWKGFNAAGLGDDEPELVATETGLPKEFALSGAGAAALDNDEDLGIEPDKNGGYTITLQEIAENGVAVTDDDLSAASEFKATRRAGAASIDDDDVSPIEVTLIPASGEAGSIDLYAFDMGSEDDDAAAQNGATGAVAALDDSDSDDGQDENQDDRPSYVDDTLDIQPEGDHQVQPGELGAAGVAGITDDGGIRPSFDAKILTGVFSDGHVRLVRVKTTTGVLEVLLRIAACNVNGNMRTRLVMQKRHIVGSNVPQWSRAWPLNFRPSQAPVPREDLFDYDFDLCTLNERFVVISLLSGLRNKTDLLSASTSPVSSVIVCREGEDGLEALCAYMWRSFDLGSDLTNKKHERYLTYAPRITATHVWPENERESYVYVAGTYLYKREDAETILGNDTPTRASGYLMRWWCSGDFFENRGTWFFDYKDIPGSIMGMHPAFESSGYNAHPRSEHVEFSIAYESSEECGLYTLSYAYDSSVHSWWHPDIKLNKNGTISGVQKFFVWNEHSAFPLTALDKDGVLCGVDTDNLKLVPISAYDKKTDDSGNTVIVPTIPGSFAFTEDGQLLIYAENKQGISGFSYEGVAQDEEPNASYEGGRYRVMACRAVKHGTGANAVTLLSKPFALCEIDHAVDGIAGATLSGSSVSLITQCITNLADSSSDYYETRVPVIACAAATSMATPGRVLFPGETANMEVTLKNVGNTQIGAAKLAVLDADSGQQVMTPVEVPFNADTIVYSLDAKPDPADPLAAPTFESGYHNELRNADGAAFDSALFAAHPLVADDGRCALQPNREATVKVPVTIPAGWSGKKRLRAVVSDIRFSNPASASAQAAWAGAAGITADCSDDGDAGGIANIAEIGDDVMDELNEPFAEDTTIDIAFARHATGNLDRIAAPQLLKQGQEVDPIDPGTGSGGSGGSGKKGKPTTGGGLTDTGDHAGFAALGALGALAVMAGAGLATYNRRRDEIAAEGGATAPSDETDKSE